MKDIFKFTFKNMKLKMKMFLYFLLLLVLEAIGLIIPVFMMSSWNSFISFLGIILMFVVIFVLSIIAYKLIVNKWVNYHYPKIKIDTKELILKFLALLTICYPLVMIFYLILITCMLLLAVFNSGILWFIGFILFIISVFQIGAISLAVLYVILEQIETDQKGYKCVFKGIVSKIKASRKYCVQILVRLTVYSIVVCSLIGMIGFIAYLLIFSIGIAIGSYGLLVGGIVVIYIVGIVLYILLCVNLYDFIIIRYANVKKLINK